MDNRAKFEAELAKLPPVPEGKGGSYVNVETELIYSASGKAVLMDRPRHLGEFWAPLSLVRQRTIMIGNQESYTAALPMWFLKKNGIQW